MKKLICILLSAALLAGLLAGCGSTAVSSTGEAPVSASEVQADSQPAEEAAAQAEPAAAEEGSAPEEALPGEPVYTVEYPVFDEPTTLSIYWCFNGFLSMFNITQDAVYENPTFVQWQEATNVNLEFTMLGEEAYMDLISLVFASGDYYDFYFAAETNYAAGPDAAVNDEILLDIAPLLAEHAPDYNAILEKDPNFRSDLTSAEGHIVSFYEYAESNDSGVVYRKDWVDQLGKEPPATMDEVMEVAREMKSEFGARNAIMWNKDLNLFFGWNAFGVTPANREDLPWQIDEDGKTVLSSVTLPGYKECLQWMHDAFAEGLVTDDFMSVLSNAFDEFIYGNETGICSCNANLLAGGGAERSGQPSFDMRALADPMKEKGMENTLAMSTGGMGQSAISISAQTEYPEECVEFMNWLYTPEGLLVSDFGVEGESFYYDEEGVPHFTDLILKDPVMPAFVAAFKYTSFVGIPFFNSKERKMATFTTEAEYECIDIWKTGRTGTNMYHGKNTADESQEYNQLAGDIMTAVNEQTLRFVTGDRSLDEYDTFVEELNQMGLGRMTELRQIAYDRYLEANQE